MEKATSKILSLLLAVFLMLGGLAAAPLAAYAADPEIPDGTELVIITPNLYAKQQPKIRIEPNPVVAYVGSTKTAIVTFPPSYTGSEEGTWRIADTSIARVVTSKGGDGVVTGKSVGETVLYFTHKETGIIVSVQVYVYSSGSGSGSSSSSSSGGSSGGSSGSNIGSSGVYAVTVEDDGNGTGSARPNQAAQGARVTLTAAPKAGYQFKEWVVVSGGAVITGNTFTMPANAVTVRAEFEPATGTVPVTSVSLNDLTLRKGNFDQLTAVISPNNATNQNVNWSSSNTSIATVDANGNVTATGTGTATITVKTDDGGETATATVQVWDMVIVEYSSPSLTERDMRVNFIGQGAPANQDGTWSVTGPNAAIDNPAIGIVRSLMPGEDYIITFNHTATGEEATYALTA